MTDANSMMQFEVVKNVTLPFVMIPGDGTPFYIKFNTPIEADKSTFSDRVRASKKEGESKQEPMRLAEVTNLQTGEIGRLVVHSVLESTLVETYPDAQYVGRCFQLKKQKNAGKRYFSFEIVEIRLKGQNSEPAKVAAKK
jgi:hypothetical protein